MSIDETSKIDFWWRDKGKGLAVLAISDHLDWDQDEAEHLLLLQQKRAEHLAPEEKCRCHTYRATHAS